MLRVVCLLLVSQVLISLPGVMSQRPFYAPHPWMDRFGQIDTGSNSIPTSTSSPSASNSNGLGDRIGNPNMMTFRYYNNVPVQGPEDPCIGCTYRLTSNGFIRI